MEWVTQGISRKKCFPIAVKLLIGWSWVVFFKNGRKHKKRDGKTSGIGWNRLLGIGWEKPRKDPSEKQDLLWRSQSPGSIWNRAKKSDQARRRLRRDPRMDHGLGTVCFLILRKGSVTPPTTACFKKHLILWKHKSDSHGIGCTPLSQSNILRPFPLEIISAAKNSCLISRMSQPFCHVLILNWTVEPLMKERGRKSPSTVEESKGEFLTEKVKCSSVAFHEYTY